MDSVRAESAAGVKERVTGAFWTAFALSLLARGETSGTAPTHLRIYADSDSVWFTLNASWNGAGWTRDSTLYNSAAFRFGRNSLEFLHDFNNEATFTTWDRSWNLPMSSTTNSAFELTGSVQEIGRLGMEYSVTAQRS